MGDSSTPVIVVVVIVLLASSGIIIWLGIEYHECNKLKSTINTDVSLPSYNSFDVAAVATDAGPCSTVAKDLLKKGGSAVDAAIGAALCISVFNTHSNSIGGGSFISIYDASTGDAVYINARDVAPASASKYMYDRNVDEKKIGPRSVAVPGEIAGYWEAHARYKKLAWKDVFNPILALVSTSPKVTMALDAALQTDPVQEALYNSNFNLEPIFLDENGTTKVKGDTVPRAELGATLRHIRDGGMDTFYRGDVAKQMVQDLMDAPGQSIMEESDLRNYRTEVKPMIRIQLGEMTVLTPSAPSGGPVLAYIMNILKGYNFTPEDLKDTNAKILAYHRILEAFKFAYAKRSELGDPSFDNTGGVDKAVEDMTNEQYAINTRLRIFDTSTQPLENYGPAYNIPPEDSGTTHISVFAEDGSAVAITSSMNMYLGSKVRGLRTGIIFNNNMADFNTPDEVGNSKNFISGGKRPLSSMAPTIILNRNGLNDTVKMVIGAAGGIKIPTATAWTIIHMLWFGMNLNDAVNAPRLHHQLSAEYPYQAMYEEGKFSDDLLTGLQALGHTMEPYPSLQSVVQGIERVGSVIRAKSDDRKGGYPDGY